MSFGTIPYRWVDKERALVCRSMRTRLITSSEIARLLSYIVTFLKRIPDNITVICDPGITHCIVERWRHYSPLYVEV